MAVSTATKVTMEAKAWGMDMEISWRMVDIAGVAGHNVAGGIAVEIADGQLLHLGKGLVTDGFLNTLGDGNHQIVLQEIGNNTHQENTGKHDDIAPQRGKIRRSGTYQWQNIIIHQAAQSSGAHGAGYCGRNDTQHDSEQIGNIMLQIA